MTMVFCRGCAKELHESATSCVQCGAPQARTAVVAHDALPDGVRGWSWGAFLLTWIWAIGNRTWIGLLALIPYVGIIVAIWLGIQGREMAWKNGRWDSVEHFNKVQRAWSLWAGGIVAAIALFTIMAMASMSVAIKNSTVSQFERGFKDGVQVIEPAAAAPGPDEPAPRDI